MEGKWLFFPPYVLFWCSSCWPIRSQQTTAPGCSGLGALSLLGGKWGALWDGCSGRVESCWCPVPTPSPAEERRLGIRIDGWGWKGVEEPCWGIEREDRGNSWDERGGGGGGKRGTPAFCSNFLERQTQTNSIGQLKGERGREKRGEVSRGGKACPDPGKAEKSKEAFFLSVLKKKNLILALQHFHALKLCSLIKI